MGRLGKKRYIFPSQTCTAEMAFSVHFPPALDHSPVTQGCKPLLHGCVSHPSAHRPAMARKPNLAIHPFIHPSMPWLLYETRLQKKRHQDRCGLAVQAVNIKLLRHGSGVERESCSQPTAEETAGSSPWMVYSKFPVYSSCLQHSDSPV